jgi:hypothetical protein
MPAEVGQVDAAAQARLQQIVCRIDFELLAVYVNDRLAAWETDGAPRRCGVSAFGIHLWRHANIPLEPHEQLIDEDLAKYD